ncbi:MAG: hypothetical protein JTT11_04280 [Candidatus Brockarchaeota archaeon]|nr:hypothetical protein [Candidatus Brockarchaeota archaeon]
MILAILRRIGKVLSPVPSGQLLASVESVPKLGAALYSSNGREVGRVEDVLGPASSPFVLVRPVSKITPGATLFVRRGRSEGKG